MADDDDDWEDPMAAIARQIRQATTASRAHCMEPTQEEKNAKAAEEKAAAEDKYDLFDFEDLGEKEENFVPAIEDILASVEREEQKEAEEEADRNFVLSMSDVPEEQPLAILDGFSSVAGKELTYRNVIGGPDSWLDAERSLQKFTPSPEEEAEAQREWHRRLADEHHAKIEELERRMQQNMKSEMRKINPILKNTKIGGGSSLGSSAGFETPDSLQCPLFSSVVKAPADDAGPQCPLFAPPQRGTASSSSSGPPVRSRAEATPVAAEDAPQDDFAALMQRYRAKDAATEVDIKPAKATTPQHTPAEEALLNLMSKRTPPTAEESDDEIEFRAPKAPSRNNFRDGAAFRKAAAAAPVEKPEMVWRRPRGGDPPPTLLEGEDDKMRADLEKRLGLKPGAFNAKPRGATAVAAAAPASSPNTSSPAICPQGHNLKGFLTDRPGYVCDFCGETQAERSRMAGCKRCDYDLCARCHKQGVPPKVKAPPEPVQKLTGASVPSIEELLAKIDADGADSDSFVD
eukprot:gnl/TRDRNA2_/TRDRNA2_163308_c0_seq1.p1 gnl/TRDRNA2_/TRDRNA2_163308_c0~~gnl/TRDRNA2_/TRDRNA2_163308_c0_seq1.p1  ORF type:complete len:536 (+),score=141.17 gnl/TRDRNA2_/TRDRNA2_163308_c0_seq1:58-1608(+)